jgi:hypothetical protein
VSDRNKMIRWIGVVVSDRNKMIRWIAIKLLCVVAWHLLRVAARWDQLFPLGRWTVLVLAWSILAVPVAMTLVEVNVIVDYVRWWRMRRRSQMSSSIETYRRAEELLPIGSVAEKPVAEDAREQEQRR